MEIGARLLVTPFQDQRADRVSLFPCGPTTARQQWSSGRRTNTISALMAWRKGMGLLGS